MSERKLAANRNNAMLSTGPRTATGKARVNHNGVRHGLYTHAMLIRSGPLAEEPGAVATFAQQVRENLAPASIVEELLADRIASLLWRLHRVPRAEAAMISAVSSAPHDGQGTLPMVVLVRDFRADSSGPSVDLQEHRRVLEAARKRANPDTYTKEERPAELNQFLSLEEQAGTSPTLPNSPPSAASRRKSPRDSELKLRR